MNADGGKNKAGGGIDSVVGVGGKDGAKGSDGKGDGGRAGGGKGDASSGSEYTFNSTTEITRCSPGSRSVTKVGPRLPHHALYVPATELYGPLHLRALGLTTSPGSPPTHTSSGSKRYAY